MKTVIFAIAFIGLAQCAKLDHLTYLPPDSRPANKDNFDQGLAAPTSGEDQGSFGTGQSRSFEPKPTASGSFNAGSQNAAHLQGSPFIPHGSQSGSGSFGPSAPGSQQNQGDSAGQQTANEQQAVIKPFAAPSTFGGSQPTQQSSNIPNQNINQPQRFSGSDEHSSFNAKPQSTNQFQGSSTFGSQGSARPQQANKPHGTYGVPDSQANLSENSAKSVTPYSSNNIQGSSFGKSSPSSTFLGTTGPGASIPYGAPFAKNSPVTNEFKSQSTSGKFGASSQPSGSFGPSMIDDNNVSPSQDSGTTIDQQNEPQSSRSFNAPAGSFDAPRSFGPGKSTGLFNNGPSAQSQSKYETSPNQIPIIRLDTKNYGDGSYSTAYETGNGIQAEEQGQTQGDSTIAQGSYSYTSPEGEKVGVSYTADEDGYHPQGDHLPTPPPIPEAILKSIEYNQAHPEEENDDGSYREPTSSESGSFDSSGQYKSPFGKTQFPGSSNKYLAPKSDLGAKNQFSGSSFSPLVRGSSTGSEGRSFPSNEPSSKQATFSSSNYPSSSGNDATEDKSGSSIPSSASNGLASTPGYQSGAPSSSGSISNGPGASLDQAHPASSSGNFQGLKPFQGASRTFPTQQTGFSSHSSFNSPAGGASGSNSGTLFGKGSNVPQGGSLGQFNSHDSTVSESNSPLSVSNEQSYGSSGAGSPSANQFSSHQSISGSSNNPNAPSSSSSSPSYPGTVSGQSSYQNYNNGPVKVSGTQQDSGNDRFTDGRQYQNVPGAQGGQNFQAYSSGPSATKSTQYQNLPDTQGQQSSQTSYSAGPSAVKSTQFQNLPGSQGTQNSQASYSSGPSATKSTQFQNLPGSQSPQNSQASYSSGPTAAKSTQFQNLPGSQGTQNSQASYSSGPSAAKSTQFQNLPGSQSPQNSQASYSSGPSAAKSTQFQNLPGSQGPQSSQVSYSSGPSAAKSTQFQNLPGSQSPQNSQASYSSGPSVAKSTQYQNLPGSQGSQNSQPSYSSGPSAATQSSGYQYNAPNTPFRNSGSSNFQQGGVSGPRSFPSGNAQNQDDLSSTRVGSGPGSPKIIGEFPAGASASHTGPARTPGVQAQDENGGYLY